MLPSPRPPHQLIAATCAVIAVASGGCGGTDDATRPGGANPTPPAAAAAPPPAPLDSGNAPPTTDAKVGDPKRPRERRGDPKLPASKGDALGAPKRGERLKLTSPASAAGAWRVGTTSSDDQLCVNAATPGAAGPPRVCNEPTLAALALSSGTGGVQSSVSAIRSTARGEPNTLLVWGLALSGVDRITVRYGTQQAEAQLSRSTAKLKLDPKVLSSLGSGITVASPAKVRTFAASFDLASINPPTIAVATPGAATSGPVTLTLQ